MLRKLDAALTSAERRDAAPDAVAYRAADELIGDLRTLEAGLVAARGERAAELLVRPVRREVEAFRFSTFRLDVRDNSPRVNAALAALWRARNSGEPPSPASPQWRAWLQSELARPLRPDRPEPPPEAAESVGLFQLIHEMQHCLDPEAVGTFILSMTHDVADILVVYLLPKDGGLFADAGAAGGRRTLAAPSPLSRPARSKGGSASRSRGRWCHSSMRAAARPPIRPSCSRPACSSIRSSPSANRRSSRRPSSTKRWRRCRARPTRRTAAWWSTPGSWTTSRRRAPSRRSPS